MARLTLRPLFVLALLVAGCLLSSPARASTAVDAVTISMGYIPNVQFAPFYVADYRGYYAAAHLKVSFDYASSPDVIRLIGAGRIAFGNAEGDQVVIGQAHGLQVVSVFAQYQRFPVVIFALHSSGIRSFADLKGKTVGLPGLYGASYTGLLAALAAAHLTTHDVHLEAIGYTQVAELAQGRVDAAVGYAMNEPVQLRQRGFSLTVLPIADLVPLAGPGVIASRTLIAQHPDLVKRFVQATYRGQQDTNANPEAAFAVSRGYMPGMSAAQVPYQLAVLREAVRYWTPSPGHGLGCASAASWAATQTTLLAQHQIAAAASSATYFTNRFVPGC